MSSSVPTAVVTPIVSPNSEQTTPDLKDHFSPSDNSNLLSWRCKEKAWRADTIAPLGSLRKATPLPTIVFSRQASDDPELEEPKMLQNVSDYSLLNNCTVALDQIDKSEHDIAALTKSICTNDRDSKYCSGTTKRTSRRTLNSRTCTLNQYRSQINKTPEMLLLSNEQTGKKRQLKSKSPVSHKRKRNVLPVRKDQSLQTKEMPQRSKLSPYSTRLGKLRTCSDKNDQNKATETVVSQTEQAFSYIPTRDDILQTFVSDVTLCAFCHLPANFLPGLGDLYGPCRPTYGELMERYDNADSKFSSSLRSRCKSKSFETESEIFVDQAESTCYVTTSCYKPADTVQDNESPFQCISGTKKNIHSMLPRMRMLQTVDSILSECNRKNAAKYSKTKRLHIPGFTGKITTSSQHKSHRTEKNVERNLLHDLNTVVFVEPTEQYSHNFPSSLHNTPTKRRSSKDGTYVDVLHTFDIKPIWVHASCAAWSPGIYSVKNQLYGIVTAVRDAANVICTFCRRPGATIACKYAKDRNYHFLCCKASNCILDEVTLTASLPG